MKDEGIQGQPQMTITKGLTDGCKGIRTAVFMEEQGFTVEFDDLDDLAYHLLVTSAGKPVATGRTFTQDGITYTLGRIATDKAFRNCHLGSLVMSGLEEHVRNLGGTTALLSAQVQARGFYEKLGYSAYGDLYDDEGCPHISMTKVL